MSCRTRGLRHGAIHRAAICRCGRGCDTCCATRSAFAGAARRIASRASTKPPRSPRMRRHRATSCSNATRRSSFSHGWSASSKSRTAPPYCCALQRDSLRPRSRAGSAFRAARFDRGCTKVCAGCASGSMRYIAATSHVEARPRAARRRDAANRTDRADRCMGDAGGGRCRDLARCASCSRKAGRRARAATCRTRRAADDRGDSARFETTRAPHPVGSRRMAHRRARSSDGSRSMRACGRYARAVDERARGRRSRTAARTTHERRRAIRVPGATARRGSARRRSAGPPCGDRARRSARSVDTRRRGRARDPRLQRRACRPRPRRGRSADREREALARGSSRHRDRCRRGLRAVLAAQQHLGSRAPARHPRGRLRRARAVKRARGPHASRLRADPRSRDHRTRNNPRRCRRPGRAHLDRRGRRRATASRDRRDAHRDRGRRGTISRRGADQATTW